jgi:hypothetical protein
LGPAIKTMQQRFTGGLDANGKILKFDILMNDKRR